MRVEDVLQKIQMLFIILIALMFLLGYSVRQATKALPGEIGMVDRIKILARVIFMIDYSDPKQVTLLLLRALTGLFLSVILFRVVMEI